MKEAMIKFDKAVNELMDICKAELGREMFGEDIYDERTLTMLQASFRLVNASMELTRKQNETMIEMNEKLDRLLMEKE